MTGVYTPKPHRGMNPSRGATGFTMDWMARMAEDKTRVVMHQSTALDPTEPVGSWELIGEPDDVFRRVKNHMEFKREFGVLPAGRYCITVPGHAHKHSFEVE